jgi:hypothetical protein
MLANRETHEFGEAAEFHFMHDVIAMAFDGAHGEADGRSNLLVAHAAGEHLENLNFAGGERSAGEGMFVGGFALERILNEIIDHGEGEFTGEERPVALNLTHGVEQIDVGIGFEDVAVGAGAEGFASDVFGKMHGEDEDIGLGGDGAYFADGVEAVHFRHGEIEQDHVGLMFFYIFQSFEAVGGFVADFEPRFEFKKYANTAAHDGVVVGDENALGLGGEVLGQ